MRSSISDLTPTRVVCSVCSKEMEVQTWEPSLYIQNIANVNNMSGLVEIQSSKCEAIYCGIHNRELNYRSSTKYFKTSYLKCGELLKQGKILNKPNIKTTVISPEVVKEKTEEL
jgi:hypothetical protein